MTVESGKEFGGLVICFPNLILLNNVTTIKFHTVGAVGHIFTMN